MPQMPQILATQFAAFICGNGGEVRRRNLYPKGEAVMYWVRFGGARRN